MNYPSRSGLAALATVAACALLTGLAQAQPAAPSRPDPLDASAPVPLATPVSALARYRPAGDVNVGSWKDANDTVTRIGGWRAYAREGQAPAQAAPATTPAVAPAVAPATVPATAPPPTSAPAAAPAAPAAAPRAMPGHGHGKH